MPVEASGETIRNVGLAIKNWLQTLHVDYGSDFFGKDLSDYPIFVVNSTPERAFANLRTLLIAGGMLDPDAVRDLVADDQYKLHPMPFASWRMLSVDPSTENQNVPGVLRTGIQSRGLSWDRYRYPTAYSAPFEINFYSKTNYSRDYIIQWVLDNFTWTGAGNNRGYLTVNFPDPWANRFVEVEFGGLNDNSTLEADDSGERLIRWTLNITVRFFDFDQNPENVQAVQSVITDIAEKDDSVDVDLGVPISTISRVQGPAILYRRSPVPFEHTQAHTTATSIESNKTTSRAVFQIDDDEKYIETVGIPFRDDQVVQGRLVIDWTDPAETTPPDLAVDVVWRDWQDDDAETVVQTFAIDGSLQPQRQGAVEINFQTMPADETYEVCLRVRQPSGAAYDVRASLRELVIGKCDLPDGAVVNPGMSFVHGGLTYNRTIDGLSPGRAYVVRCLPHVASEDITINLYGDVGRTHLLATETFTEDGREFVAYVAPDADRFVLEAVIGSPDLEALVDGIWVCRAVVRPL